MKKAKVYNFGDYTGDLCEIEKAQKYKFIYDKNYYGPAISLTMPISKKEYEYNQFPPFFEGLLPEGTQLDALVRQAKIDRNDLFFQLVLVGRDLVGSITVSEEK
jgi:serine/threonine-protein kinase HipA